MKSQATTRDSRAFAQNHAHAAQLHRQRRRSFTLRQDHRGHRPVRRPGLRRNPAQHRARHRRGGAQRPRLPGTGLVPDQRRRARPPADAAVRQGGRACRRTGADRAARLRQAHQTGQGRRAGAGALLRVLRRRLRQAARRDHSLPRRLQRDDLARAARRDRPHHSVELPDADFRPQRRRRAGGGQCLRGQARRRRLPVADARGAAGDRSRLSGRRAQHRDRLRP